MIKTFSILVLLITLFNFGSFAEEIQAFNFTKEEFDNLVLEQDISKNANRMRKSRSIDKLLSLGYIEKDNNFYRCTNKPTP